MISVLSRACSHTSLCKVATPRSVTRGVSDAMPRLRFGAHDFRAYSWLVHRTSDIWLSEDDSTNRLKPTQLVQSSSENDIQKLGNAAKKTRNRCINDHLCNCYINQLSTGLLIDFSERNLL